MADYAWTTGGLPDLIHLSKIGSGAYGEVHKMFNESTKEIFARKLIPMLGPNRTEDLSNEIRAITKCCADNHANIVYVYTHFPIQNSSCYAIDMEFCELTLADYIHGNQDVVEKNSVIYSSNGGANYDERALKWHSIGTIMQQICEVLYSVRSKTWKITDFGFAAEGSSKKLIVSQGTRGTDSYRAPELITSQIYTRKVDIWAIGCIFYEIITRQKTFKNDWEVGKYKMSNTPLVIPNLDFHYHHSEQFFLRTIRETLSIDWKQRPKATTLIQAFLHFMDEIASGPSQSFPLIHTTTTIGDNTSSIEPTYFGYLATYSEALLILEAARNNKILRKVTRQPRYEELDHLIKSGNIFVFNTESLGIRQWIDGIHWSKAVEFGHCLYYRELDQPDEKKGRKKRPRPTQTYKEKKNRSTSLLPGKRGYESDLERWSEGEDSPILHNFKEGGLLKKTLSVEFEGAFHFVIMYFTIEDVSLHRLPSPSNDSRLARLVLGNDLRSKFSAELDSETQDLKGIRDNDELNLPTISLSEAISPHLKHQILTVRERLYSYPAAVPTHQFREVHRKRNRRSQSPNYPLSAEL